MKTQLICALLLTFLSGQKAWALCVSAPSQTTVAANAEAGHIQYSPGTGAKFTKLVYCDGTNWKDFPGTPTATACTSAGEVKYISGEYFYCNGAVLWPFDSSATTNGACTKEGELKWNSSTTKLEFCNGTNWRVVSTTDTTAEPLTDSIATNANLETSSIFTQRITGFVGGGSLVATTMSGNCASFVLRYCADSSCSSSINNRTSVGTVSGFVPNASYIRSSFTSSVLGSETCTIVYTIAGQTITHSVTTVASDLSPTVSASSFTEQRGVATSTVINSNILKVSSHTGVDVSISDNGFGGSPQFRTCSDATCTAVLSDWGNVTVAIPNPAWVQVRVTTGATVYDIKSVTATIGDKTAKLYAMTSDCPRFGSLAAGASLTCSCPALYKTIYLNAATTRGIISYSQSGDLCNSAIHAGVYNDATGGSVTVQGTTAGTPAGTCTGFKNGGTVNGVVSSSTTTDGPSMWYPSGLNGADICNP